MSDQFTVGVRFDLDLDHAEAQLDHAEQTIRGRLLESVKDTERAADRMGTALDKAGDQGASGVGRIGTRATETGGHLSRLGTGGSAALGGLAEAAGRGAAKFGEMALNVGKIATVVVGGGLAALTGVGLKTAASLEMAQTGFNTLLGGAQQGQQFFQGLIGIANQSAFEVGQLTGPAQTLLAVFKGDGAQATAALKTMGDGVALLGKNSPEALGRLADGFGKMASQGKVGMESLNIIGEALPGFSARTALAEGYAERFGGTAEQAMKKISEGTIDAQTGTEILLGKMREFPGLSGAMIAQSKTLSGVLSTFADTFKSSLAFDLAGPLIEPVKTAVLGLNDLLGPALSGLGKVIAPVAADLLPKLLEGIGPLITQLPVILGPLVEGFGAVFGQLAPVIGEVATMLVPIAENLGGLFSELAPEIANIVRVFAQFAGPLASVFSIIGTVVANAAPGIISLLDALAGGLTTLGPVLFDLGGEFGNLIAELAVGLVPVITALLPTIIGLAHTFAPLIGVLIEVARMVLPAVATALGLLLPSFGQLATAFVTLLPTLLPLIPPLTQMLVLLTSKVLVPVVEALAKALLFMAEHGEATRAVVVALAAGFVALSLPVSGVVAAIAAVAAGAVYAYKHFEPFREVVDKVAAALKTAAVWVGHAAVWLGTHLVDAAKKVWSFLSGGFHAAVTGISTAFRAVAFAVTHPIEALGRFLSFAGQWIPKLGGLLLSGLSALGGLMVEGFTIAWGWLSEAVSGLVSTAVDWLARLPGLLVQGMVNLAATLITFFLSDLPLAALEVIAWAGTAVAWLATVPGKMWDGMKTVATDIAGWILGEVPHIVDTVTVWAGTAVSWLAGLPGFLWDGMKNFATDLVTWIELELPKVVASVSKWVDGAVDWLKDLPGNLVSGVGDIAGSLGSALLSGFKGAWNYLADRFKIDIPKIEVLGGTIYSGGTVSLPHLYARGGYADTPTLGVFGEAGSELVVPVANSGAAAALARSYPRPAAQAAFSLLSGLGLTTPAAGGAGAVTVNASVTVAGNVYGVDDLDRYMDARDAQLARLLTSRVGAR